MSDEQPPAGWFADPYDPTRLRWWDGSQWTDDVAPVPEASPAPGSVDQAAASAPATTTEPVAQVAQASGPASADELAGLDLPSDHTHRRATRILAAASFAVVVFLAGVAYLVLSRSDHRSAEGPPAAPTDLLPSATSLPAATSPATTVPVATTTGVPSTTITEPTSTTTSAAPTTTEPPPDCNQIVPPLPPLRYEDVGDVSAEAKDALRWAEAVGLVSLGERQFRPTDTMNRAEATTVLWRYFCTPTPAVSAGFTDVSAGYFTDAVDWAAGKGIVTGTTATTFDPSGALNRAQFVTMAWRAVGSPTGAPPNPFTDSARGVFYTQALDWAFNAGLVNGLNPTTFAPEQPLDRLTVIVLFWRLENRVDPPVN